MILSDRATDLLRRLEPFLIGCEETSETTGSVLLSGDTITLCTYRLVPEAAALLRESADRLYDWAEPELPQDLCLLRGTEPWLITLATDRAASLLIPRTEAQAIRVANPGLALREARTE